MLGRATREGALDLAASFATSAPLPVPILPQPLPPLTLCFFPPPKRLIAGQWEQLPLADPAQHLPGTGLSPSTVSPISEKVPYSTFTTPSAGSISVPPALGSIGLGP